MKRRSFIKGVLGISAGLAAIMDSHAENKDVGLYISTFGEAKIAPYQTYVWKLQNGGYITMYSDDGIQFFKTSDKWRGWSKEDKTSV